MKNSTYILLALFFTSNIYCQYQDPIKNYPGIPLITYGYGISNYPDSEFVKMKNAGIFAVEAIDLEDSVFANKISQTGLKVMPEQRANDVLHSIVEYTEGRYTTWEAEGIPESDGKAKLFYNQNYILPGSTFINTRTDLTIPNNTILVAGPSYRQEATYFQIKPTVDSVIHYIADYRLKLDEIIPQENLPNDTICILQVTVSNITVVGEIWDTVSTYVVKDSVLLFSDFIPSIWDTVQIQYRLDNIPPVYINPTWGRPTETNPDSGLYQNFRNNVDNIEFRIIWKGNSNNVKLSLDKINVYDERGRRIKNPQTLPSVVNLINTQLLNSGNYVNSTAGWIGIDEPWCIDNFEPIRIVDSIVNASASQAKLWIAFVGSWSGRWGNWANPSQTMHMIMIDEYMRRVKNANLWVNSYYFDIPYSETHPPGWPYNNIDYRIKNIDMVADSIYERFNETAKLPGVNLYWGASIQTGIVRDSGFAYQEFRYREINGRELLYQTNLALLYGAKLISPWLYFGFQRPQVLYSGIVNSMPIYSQPPYSETDKYKTLRDTIGPRLKGLMGIKIKSLDPYKQFAGSNGISYSNISWDHNPNGYEYIEDITPSDTILSIDEYGLDMGFFNDSLSSDKIYFMVLNRYYSSKSNYSIKLKDLNDYYNWNLTNYVDTTSTTLLTANNKTTFLDTLLKGDANLYSIAPVVKYGGLLAYNDTIKVNTTLADNMTIDAGKVLQINEGKTYSITDTITFTDTSSFITGYGYINCNQNGWITTRSWNKSLFKGRSGSHPKLIWSKHPDISNVIEYKIYRNYASEGWQYLTSKSNSTFEYVDTTITIIEGMPQANEVSTEYRVTATYRPSKLEIETSYSNTITYQRVEGQGLEKQYSGLTSNDFTYNLDQNYPNPFNPTTTINYSIAEDGLVEIEILNILGERIKTLVNEFKTKGNHNISFNASLLASGVYVYKLQAGDFISSKKMILLK